MSASRVLPTWRPLTYCCERVATGRCEQQATAGSDRCYYHAKMADPKLGMLTGTEARARVGNHSPSPRARYDYGLWFDGRPHTLRWNHDFAADVKSMKTMLRKASVRHGVEITVEDEGGLHGTITVQARPKAEAGAA